MIIERARPEIPQEVQAAALELRSLINIDLCMLKDNSSWIRRNEYWEKAAERHPQFTGAFKDISDVMAAFRDAAGTSLSSYERLLDYNIGLSLSREFGIGTPLKDNVPDILGIIVWNRSGRLTPDNYNDNAFDKLSEQLAQELEIADADGNLDADSSEKLTANDVLCAVLQGKLKISHQRN